MRSFDITIGTTATISVPDQFLKDMRESAQAENATSFEKATQELHPEDDDAFLLAILTNGVRIGVREILTKNTQEAGMGLRLAPAKVDGVARGPRLPPPEGVEPLLIEVKKPEQPEPKFPNAEAEAAVVLAGIIEEVKQQPAEESAS